MIEVKTHHRAYIEDEAGRQLFWGFGATEEEAKKHLRKILHGELRRITEKWPDGEPKTDGDKRRKKLLIAWFEQQAAAKAAAKAEPPKPDAA